MSDKQKDLNENVIAIAEQLRGAAKINEEKHRVEFEKGDDIYYSTLPEGLDKKAVIAMDKHRVDFALAQSLVTGELGAEYLGKNKQVEKVTSKIAHRTGFSTATLEREHTVYNNMAKDEKDRVTVVNGYIRPRIVTNVQASGLIAVRNRVAEAAAKFKLGA